MKKTKQDKVAKTGNTNSNISAKNTPNKKSNPKGQQKGISVLDKIKVAFAFVLLLVGLVLFYQYPTLGSVRYVFPLIGILLFGLIIVFWCSFGIKLLIYFKDATIEVKKVVWPERKTALNMTIMVIAFIFILTLFMWLSDAFLRWVLYDLILKRGG